MSTIKVKTIFEKVLYQRSETVTKFDSELRNLVKNMFDTMYSERGVGLAAVQIGVLKRVMVIDLEDSGFIKGTFINPVLVEQSEEIQIGEEGCLSVPGVVAQLKRPRWVKIGYQDIFGEPKTVEGENLLARAFLHEMDHLEGKVFIDLLEPDIRKEVEPQVNIIKKGGTIADGTRPDYRKNK